MKTVSLLKAFSQTTPVKRCLSYSSQKIANLYSQSLSATPLKIEDVTISNNDKSGLEVAAHSFISILEGNLTGMHARSLLTHDYCRQVETRFHASSLKKARGDGVPGYEAGVTQYKKHPATLAKLSYAQHGRIRDILGDENNEIMEFFRLVSARAAQRGYLMRAATFGCEPMTMIRFSQWMRERPNDRLLVQMHDDLAQMKTAEVRDAGFEIGDVVRLVAYNFYIKARKSSGQLFAVDWQPTHEERTLLGVADTGYPYRQEDVGFLEQRQRHVFEQETSDLIVLDGSYVHGVLVGKDECRDRLVANGFAALLPNNNIVLFA